MIDAMSSSRVQNGLFPANMCDCKIELFERFDADRYDGIQNLMLSDAYALVPDHYLDVNHPDYESGLLTTHVNQQTQRVLIDLVNNCDTGDEYEAFIASLRLRYAALHS